MKRMLVLVLAVLAMLVLAACATKEDTGTLAGGAAGAVVGEQVGGRTGLLIGAIGGALLGREVGQRLDDEDREEVATALEQERTGQTRVWTDPDSGERYSVTPTETFERDGRPCRRFTMDIEGQVENVEGTACRTAAGDWQIVG
jgi:surface antigen